MRKRASIEFVKSSEIEATALKFGGAPYGLPASLWPVSRQMTKPMQFICQIPFGPSLFPGVTEAVAYLFMTSSDDCPETWVAGGGENALIVLQREELTGGLTVADAPPVCRMEKRWWSKRLIAKPCVFHGKLITSEDPDFIPEAELLQMPETQIEAYRAVLSGTKLGGSPGFLQNDELPMPAPWHLLLQLDSAQIPFWINFGDAGIGYAFINGNGTEGKFFWQCC